MESLKVLRSSVIDELTRQQFQCFTVKANISMHNVDYLISNTNLLLANVYA